jgi:E-phenylitaconyl-CoA hydratase
MLRTEVRPGGIFWMTLDDPTSLNATDQETMDQLAAAWHQLRVDPALKVAVLTGAGDRSFCIGSNLKKLIPKIHAGMDLRTNQGAYFKGPDGPVFKPIIGAVNGECLGGGMELLTGTDIRLAVPHARFGQPEVTLGLFPAGGATVRLMRQLPYAHAMDILLTGRFLTAEEAVAIGLVNRIVAAEDLHAEAMKVAEQIAANASFALQRIKESAYRTYDLPLREGNHIEDELAAEVFRSNEAAEGLAAFAAKRRPNFG